LAGFAGSPTANVPPLSADFTFFGGIYRGVHLLSTPPLAISPMDFASPGVLFQLAVDSELRVKVV